jgi:YXWGXW repeat-containing protein
VNTLKNRRGPVVATVLAGAMLIGSAVPALSAVDIDINVAPPAPRIVEAPSPRPGFVWAPGYYRWDGHRHVWVDGRFIHERRGSHWVPEHWSERHGRYHFIPGHWERG